MPKIIDPSQLKFKCPYCEKSYKTNTSLYPHVKNCHPGKPYSSAISKQVKVLCNHKKQESIAISSLNSSLDKLKQELSIGTIQLQDFIELAKEIQDQIDKETIKLDEKRRYEEAPNFDFEIFLKVMSNNYDPLTDWIEENDLYNPLIHLIKDGLHGKAFTLIFKNNLRIEPDGMKHDELNFKATYIEHGYESSSHNIDLDCLWTWYSQFIKALYYITLTHRERVKGRDLLMNKSGDEVTDAENFLINAGIEDLKPIDDLCQMLGACSIKKNNTDGLNQIHSILPCFDRRLKIK